MGPLTLAVNYYIYLIIFFNAFLTLGAFLLSPPSTHFSVMGLDISAIEYNSQPRGLIMWPNASPGCVGWECCSSRYTSPVLGSMSTLHWVGRVMCSAILQKTEIRSERLTVPEEPPAPCDFGTGGPNLDMCTWLIPPNASPRSKWRLGMGELSAWIGGPRADHTTSDKQGNLIRFWNIGCKRKRVLSYNPSMIV